MASATASRMDEMTIPVIPAILVVHAVSGPEAKMKETAAAAAIKNEFSDRQF